MSALTRPLPLLRDGERMDAEEFFRRYEATPEGFRAELVQGVVHVPPPASFDDHGFPHGQRVFPGFWLDPDALLRGDLAQAEAVLRQGLASPEHAAFVADLAARGSGA